MVGVMVGLGIGRIGCSVYVVIGVVLEVTMVRWAGRSLDMVVGVLSLLGMPLMDVEVGGSIKVVQEVDLPMVVLGWVREGLDEALGIGGEVLRWAVFGVLGGRMICSANLKVVNMLKGGDIDVGIILVRGVLEF